MIKEVIITLATVLAICEAQAYWNQRISHGGSGQAWGRPRPGGWGGQTGGWAANRPQFAHYNPGGYPGGSIPVGNAWAGGYTGGAHIPQPQVAVQPPIASGQPHLQLRPQVGLRPQYVRPYSGGYEDESPKPYSFGYNTADEYGTQLGRQETADGSGNVRGSYSYRDASGQFRQVQYEADGGGFRAVVDTNEHGVVSHRPADAVYNVHN